MVFTLVFVYFVRTEHSYQNILERSNYVIISIFLYHVFYLFFVCAYIFYICNV